MPVIPGKRRHYRIGVDFLEIELNALKHDIGRARGDQVDTRSIVFPSLDAAPCVRSPDLTAVNDKTAAEHGGVFPKNNLIAVARKYL